MSYFKFLALLKVLWLFLGNVTKAHSTHPVNKQRPSGGKLKQASMDGGQCSLAWGLLESSNNPGLPGCLGPMESWAVAGLGFSFWRQPLQLLTIICASSEGSWDKSSDMKFHVIPSLRQLGWPTSCLPGTFSDRRSCILRNPSVPDKRGLFIILHNIMCSRTSLWTESRRSGIPGPDPWGCKSRSDSARHWVFTVHVLASLWMQWSLGWKKHCLIEGLLSWWRHAISPSKIWLWIGLRNKRRREGKNFFRSSQLIRRTYRFNFVMKQIFSATERQGLRQSIWLMINTAVSAPLVFKTKGSHLDTASNSLTLNWSDSITENFHRHRNKTGIS